METKTFGWTGVQVPVVGQGTWHMGESRQALRHEQSALRLGLDLGLTHIDTAEMYAQGAAEEVIAAAIRDRRRSDLFLVSKVLPQNASYQGTIRAAERSLSRLGTDYLDLYLLHWPGRYPIAETMGAMEDLVSAGKIRLVGVSNFDVSEMRAAMKALTRERLTCNQVLYNLGTRGIERDVIPFCEQHQIAVVGYTPFGRLPARNTAGWQTLSEIARQLDKTPRQIVLRFLTRLPCLFAIPKASDRQHVRENAEGVGFDLDDEKARAIERAFPAPKRPVPLEMG